MGEAEQERKILGLLSWVKKKKGPRLGRWRVCLVPKLASRQTRTFFAPSPLENEKVRKAKEEFNGRVSGAKRRKRELVTELEAVSERLISVQLSLEAEKRKPVPSVPVLHADELDRDPFHVMETCVRHEKDPILIRSIGGNDRWRRRRWRG